MSYVYQKCKKKKKLRVTDFISERLENYPDQFEILAHAIQHGLQL